jgi:hypothetical protein
MSGEIVYRLRVVVPDGAAYDSFCREGGLAAGNCQGFAGLRDGADEAYDRACRCSSQSERGVARAAVPCVKNAVLMELARVGKQLLRLFRAGCSTMSASACGARVLAGLFAPRIDAILLRCGISILLRC